MASPEVPYELRCSHTPAQVRPLTCYACTADDLLRLYTAAKNAYYSGNPILFDSTYDWLEKRCREQFPDDIRFWQVGKIKPEDKSE